MRRQTFWDERDQISRNRRVIEKQPGHILKPRQCCTQSGARSVAWQRPKLGRLLPRVEAEPCQCGERSWLPDTCQFYLRCGRDDALLSEEFGPDANTDQHSISKPAVPMANSRMFGAVSKRRSAVDPAHIVTTSTAVRYAERSTVMKTAPGRHPAITSEAALSPLATSNPLKERYHAHSLR